MQNADFRPGWAISVSEAIDAGRQLDRLNASKMNGQGNEQDGACKRTRIAVPIRDVGVFQQTLSRACGVVSFSSQ